MKDIQDPPKSPSIQLFSHQSFKNPKKNALLGDPRRPWRMRFTDEPKRPGGRSWDHVHELLALKWFFSSEKSPPNSATPNDGCFKLTSAPIQKAFGPMTPKSWGVCCLGPSQASPFFWKIIAFVYFSVACFFFGRVSVCFFFFSLNGHLYWYLGSFQCSLQCFFVLKCVFC